MESYDTWDVMPFDRTFIPIYALFSIKDSYFPPFVPTLLLLRHAGLRDKKQRIGLY